MTATIKVGKYQMALPRSRRIRIILGSVLIVGGVFGFLPVLGFWMMPLGLLILSVDLPVVRRLRRRLELWWGRRRANDGSARDG